MRHSLPASLSALSLSLAGLAMPAAAPAQSVAGAPPGSYLLTCVVTKIDTTAKVMVAQCKMKNGVVDQSSFKYRFCYGDIQNLDGKLFCEIDYAKLEEAKQEAKTAKLKAEAAQQEADLKKAVADAKPALASAAQVVLGRAPTPGESWLWSQMMIQSPATKPLVMATLKFSDATSWLKSWLAEPERAQERQNMVDRAYREVWGRVSAPAELAAADASIRAKALNYSQLVVKQRDVFRNTPGANEAAVRQMTQSCMGRAPTAQELGYWKQQPHHYAQMVSTCRDTLYGPSGAKDLVETITRAKTALSGKAPSDAEVKAAITQYGKSKAIFDEMAKPLFLAAGVKWVQ